MIVFVDCEGEPLQEFTALYVDVQKRLILDVFHHHVCYPFTHDKDSFSRRHIHGLNRDFLSRHGLSDESALLLLFREWLSKRPYSCIYAHGPEREKRFLSLPIQDVCLKPWKERIHCYSHQVALSLKLNFVPICGVTCHAHDEVTWKVNCKNVPSETDFAKKQFFHHCSLYDCVECFLYFLQEE